MSVLECVEARKDPKEACHGSSHLAHVLLLMTRTKSDIVAPDEDFKMQKGGREFVMVYFISSHRCHRPPIHSFSLRSHEFACFSLFLDRFSSKNSGKIRSSYIIERSHRKLCRGEDGWDFTRSPAPEIGTWMGFPAGREGLWQVEVATSWKQSRLDAVGTNHNSKIYATNGKGNSSSQRSFWMGYVGLQGNQYQTFWYDFHISCQGCCDSTDFVAQELGVPVACGCLEVRHSASEISSHQWVESWKHPHLGRHLELGNTMFKLDLPFLKLFHKFFDACRSEKFWQDSGRWSFLPPAWNPEQGRGQHMTKRSFCNRGNFGHPQIEGSWL